MSVVIYHEARDSMFNLSNLERVFVDSDSGNDLMGKGAGTDAFVLMRADEKTSKATMLKLVNDIHQAIAADARTIFFVARDGRIQTKSMPDPIEKLMQMMDLMALAKAGEGDEASRLILPG